MARKGYDQVERFRYASYILQSMLDRLLMFGNVTTTRFFATLSTFQVVRGINGLTLWTGIVFPNILKPMFIAHGPDLLQVIPKLNPMRPFRLKLF